MPKCLRFIKPADTILRVKYKGIGLTLVIPIIYSVIKIQNNQLIKMCFMKLTNGRTITNLR